jgi:hypothetical protein
MFRMTTLQIEETTSVVEQESILHWMLAEVDWLRNRLRDDASALESKLNQVFKADDVPVAVSVAAMDASVQVRDCVFKIERKLDRIYWVDEEDDAEESA